MRRELKAVFFIYARYYAAAYLQNSALGATAITRLCLHDIKTSKVWYFFRYLRRTLSRMNE